MSVYIQHIILKLSLFIISFTILYFSIQYADFRFATKLSDDLKSVYYIFYYAISLIFSIISGFIIQSQWHKWDTIIDSTRGEVNMLRQLFNIAHHFPEKERDQIKVHIYRYIDMYIVESLANPNNEVRSKNLDGALNQLEDTMFGISKRFPALGSLAFGLLSRALEYRDIKIQNGSHHLPISIRIYLIFAASSLVFTLLFVAYHAIFFDYIFTLITSLLAYGIYLLVDDFDHPYSPRNLPQTISPYKELLSEIKEHVDTLK